MPALWLIVPYNFRSIFWIDNFILAAFLQHCFYLFFKTSILLKPFTIFLLHYKALSIIPAESVEEYFLDSIQQLPNPHPTISKKIVMSIPEDCINSHVTHLHAALYLDLHISIPFFLTSSYNISEEYPSLSS